MGNCLSGIVSFGKLSGGKLSFGKLSGGKLTSGKLSSEKLSVRSCRSGNLSGGKLSAHHKVKRMLTRSLVLKSLVHQGLRKAVEGLAYCDGTFYKIEMAVKIKTGTL